MRKRTSNWLFALALTAPMLLFYAGYYFNHAASLSPTGFIAYDNVSYIAYAKEYLDQDQFSLFYPNPLNDSADHPAIYFQLQTVLFAFLLWLGMAPGLVIVLFNIAGTLLSFRVVIAIYDHLFPNSARRWLFISFFCWGGGLLALAGIPIALTRDMGNLDFMDRLFFLDPAWGWWGLNLGRGHFISSEGFYHFLFLAGIYFILKQRWKAALVFALALSLSHPFTGIEYLSITTVWAAIEKFVARKKAVPWAFVLGSAALLLFHLCFYLIYLNQFPEHRSVSEQYALNWRLRYFSMLPAYCIVGTLALVTFWRSKKVFFQTPAVRLFTAWFAVAFLLANHELFLKPMQPLHFTRGYVWTSLFLLGIPALHLFYQNGRKKLVLILFTLLFFSDNALWIFNAVRFKATSPSTAYITKEQQLILRSLKKYSDNRTLVVSKDETLPYLATVYTASYPWFSHPYTTPFAAKKKEALDRYMDSGMADPAWKHRDLVLIFQKWDEAQMQRFHMLPNEAIVLADTENYVMVKTRLSP